MTDEICLKEDPDVAEAVTHGVEFRKVECNCSECEKENLFPSRDSQ